MKVWAFGSSFIKKDDVWNYLDAISATSKIDFVVTGDVPIGTEMHVIDWCDKHKINNLVYKEISQEIIDDEHHKVKGFSVGIAFFDHNEPGARNRETANLLEKNGIKIIFAPTTKKV